MLAAASSTLTLKSWYVRHRVITPAAGPVVTLAEIKAHLRLDMLDTSEDATLTMLEQACRELLEQWLRRYLLTTGVEGMTALAPPGGFGYWWEGVLTASARAIGVAVCELPMLPLAQVTDVAVVDRDGTVTPLPAAAYYEDASDPDQIGRVILRSEYIPSINAREVNSLRFQYDVGYGANAPQVPAAIRVGLLDLIAYKYTNRGACGCDADGTDGAISGSGVSGLLHRYRWLG